MNITLTVASEVRAGDLLESPVDQTWRKKIVDKGWQSVYMRDAMTNVAYKHTRLSAGSSFPLARLVMATAGKSKTLRALKTLGVFYFQWLVDQAVSG